MASIKSLKNPDNYFCEGCNYETYSKKDFNKHILTAKHNKLENASKMLADSVNLSSYHNQQFICNCGIEGCKNFRALAEQSGAFCKKCIDIKSKVKTKRGYLPW